MSAYQPYESDTPSETDTETESDTSEDPRITREQDPRYAILTGPHANATGFSKMTSGSSGSPWDATGVPTSMASYAYTTPPKSTKTSLISIKSTDRDRSVWPTPFRFQLKLPRVYKDITKFQLVQMSFPNNASNVQLTDLYTSSIVTLLSTAGVPTTCFATCVGTIQCSNASNTIGLMELARTNTSGAPLMATVVVPTGSYSDAQLASELTAQANSTPPLNLVSFSTFQDVYQNTGDLSLLFNEPGDTYCSKVTNQRLGAHTKEQIMNTYYTQQHVDSIGLGSITDDVAFVAYYFPILKETIATGNAQPFLSTAGLTFDDMKQAVMGPFQGLDSPLYSTLCHVNQTALDGYRPYLTFEHRPINKYVWSYNESARRFTTVHDTLHPSLMRDLKKQYSTVYQQELSAQGLNGNSFQTLKSNQIAYQSVYKHLERNLSSVLGGYHLASGYSYAGGETHATSASTFQASDLNADEDFSGMFQYKSTFGRIFGNYGGTSLSFQNFGDYHSTLSSYYQLSRSTQTAVSSIHGRIAQDYHSYVSTKYGSVLPSSMIQTRSYLSGQAVPVSFVTNQTLYLPGMSPPGWTSSTAALASSAASLGASAVGTSVINADSATDGSSNGTIDLQTLSSVSSTGTNGYTVTDTTTCADICCYVLQKLVNSWYSTVPVNTVVNSLAYRTGILNMQPSSFNLLSTIFQITSTSNTNLLIQINDEQGFNNMDLTMPENYQKGNDPTGQVKLIAGKILMDALGNSGISQTVIQNPTVFENTLGKLDRLDFRIYYDDGQLTPAWQYLPFFLSISEWDATFQIDEQVGVANQADAWSAEPSVPIPNNPNATPFLYYQPKSK